ncbi:unnamed protein product [Arctia plantaginis]|uniref:Centrosomal protein of 78 kDa n=1 Tax=Arctia plantaginis TaxID=874455 RepID=A0A8S0Z909_ARCPL|nr:unnamed protein product [Arctia plantaginis]
MVGKGSEQNSRIFHQCYLNCCKLQNLTPLNYVIPSGNGKVLDFCVDRIKYIEWPAILNALSCDLSLHYVSIKCRQQVKTVLEHIDCERLAKTVNKRCVLLTNFMLTNLIEAITQMLSNTTLLTTLILEGIPLRIPYLNPLCETILINNCLQHLHLSQCLIGDAGCLAICKSLRCLPNILTLNLSGCELTPLGAEYIADLVKYQKIHRYSENWTHTLRYRLPDLDTMAGLRRITVCSNPAIGDVGVAKLFEVLADDLWIKALDVQNCSLTEKAGTAALNMLKSNTTLVILDLRHNVEVTCETLSKIRTVLRNHERGTMDQLSWLSSSSSSGHLNDRLNKPVANKNGVMKDKTVTNLRSPPNKNTSNNIAKKEKEYIDNLEEQLQEEISYRHQLEELNLQLVSQMKEMKQQQVKMWLNNAASSESEPSLGASFPSGDVSTSSGSSNSVPIDQTTLSYIQQAFKDIYSFIKSNQCYGQCVNEKPVANKEKIPEAAEESPKSVKESSEIKDQSYTSELRVNVVPKRAQSSHIKIRNSKMVKKMTKSAHMLGENQLRVADETKPEMFEKHMGDTRNTHNAELELLDDIITAQVKTSNEKSSPCSSVSSDTLVCSPLTRRSVDEHEHAVTINPREAFYSSSESDDESQ